MTGDDVRAIRERLGWTQQRMANELRSHTAVVCRIETGKREVRGILLRAIEAIVRDHPDELADVELPDPPEFGLESEPALDAEDIKAIRLERGWTQVRMAEYLGVRQTTVGRYEKGMPAPMPVQKLLRQLQDRVADVAPEAAE